MLLQIFPKPAIKLIGFTNPVNEKMEFQCRFICLFLIVNDVEHHFMWLGALQFLKFFSSCLFSMFCSLIRLILGIPLYIQKKNSSTSHTSGNCFIDCHLHFDFFFFLGMHRWHMEVLKLEVELEWQLPAYTTATALSNAGSLTH